MMAEEFVVGNRATPNFKVGAGARCPTPPRGPWVSKKTPARNALETVWSLLGPSERAARERYELPVTSIFTWSGVAFPKPASLPPWLCWSGASNGVGTL
jgi:hypothetical protein